MQTYLLTAKHTQHYTRPYIGTLDEIRDQLIEEASRWRRIDGLADSWHDQIHAVYPFDESELDHDETLPEVREVTPELLTELASDVWDVSEKNVALTDKTDAAPQEVAAWELLGRVVDYVVSGDDMRTSDWDHFYFREDWPLGLDARTADVEKYGLELWKNWREDADGEPELVSSSVWVTHANGADTSDSTEAIGVLPAGVHDKLVAFLLDYEGEV